MKIINMHGQKILQELKKVGKKQPALAEYCGVSRQAVNKWCNDGEIKAVNAVDVCKFFGRPLSWLIPNAKNVADYEYMFKCILNAHLVLKGSDRLNKVDSREFTELVMTVYLKNESEDDIISAAKAREISKAI